MDELLKKDLSIHFATVEGEEIKFHKGVSGDYFMLEVTQSNSILLYKKDVYELMSTLRELEINFDSYLFSDLQYTLSNKVPEKLIKLSDERLMDLARYNDEHPPYKKIFTLHLRTELFKRNGLKKAGYKLSFEQKAFLYSQGLKMS